MHMCCHDACQHPYDGTIWPDALPRFAPQGIGAHDPYNMQGIARALSDTYRPQQLGADSQSAFDRRPDSFVGSTGGSLFGSLQSDCPVMNSPFHTVRLLTAGALFLPDPDRSEHHAVIPYVSNALTALLAISCRASACSRCFISANLVACLRECERLISIQFRGLSHMPACQTCHELPLIRCAFKHLNFLPGPRGVPGGAPPSAAAAAAQQHGAGAQHRLLQRTARGVCPRRDPAVAEGAGGSP